MKEMNAKVTGEKKNKGKRIICHGNLVCETCFSIRRGFSKQVWPLRWFSTVSLMLTGLQPDKTLFPTCQDCQVYQEFGAKIIDNKVAEIKVPYNFFRDLNYKSRSLHEALIRHSLSIT